MSRILEKAFDASKKIVRSIFNGAPNLITTSDLNRQFEALKNQVDKLDEKTGFIIEGAQLWSNLNGSTLKVGFLYDTMEYKGCSFDPNQEIAVETNFTTSAPTAYLCLLADKETVTYETDSTHEIAGAKFADGTSMRAADQVVYKNERFVLTHSAESLTDLVGIVAFFSLVNGRVYMRENWTSFYSPLRMKDSSGLVGAPFETTQKYPIVLGETYDTAFGKLQGYLGDAKVIKGCWGYIHAGIDEINPTDYEAMTKKTPAELIKVGPIYYIRLGGFTTFGGIGTETVRLNLKDLLMGGNTDTGGVIVFKDFPGTYNIGSFMGATIGVPPFLEITNTTGTEVNAQQRINCLSVSSNYVENIQPQYDIDYAGFNLDTRGNYDKEKFSYANSNITGFSSAGVAVTLMFADRSIW